MAHQNFGIHATWAQWIGHDRLHISCGTRLQNALLPLGEGPCMIEVRRTADGGIEIRPSTQAITLTTQRNIVFVSSANTFLNAALRELAGRMSEVRVMDPARFRPGQTAPRAPFSFIFDGTRSFFHAETRRLVAWVGPREEAIIWRLQAGGHLDVSVFSLGDRYGRKALAIQGCRACGRTFGGVSPSGNLVLTTDDEAMQACLSTEGYARQPIISQHERLFH